MSKKILIGTSVIALGVIGYFVLQGVPGTGPGLQGTVGLARQERAAPAGLAGLEALAAANPELRSALATPGVAAVIEETAALSTRLALGVLLPGASSVDDSVCHAGLLPLQTGEVLILGWTDAGNATNAELRDADGRALQAFDVVGDPGEGEPASFISVASFPVEALTGYQVAFQDPADAVLCSAVARLRPSVRDLGLELSGISTTLEVGRGVITGTGSGDQQRDRNTGGGTGAP